MGKGAHNWNGQHVNSNFFSDDPSISQLGAAVEPLFSLRPIFHFHVQHFSTGFLSKSYFIFVSPCPTACVDLPLPFGQFSTFLRPICHIKLPMPVFCPIAYNLAFAAETEKVAAAAGQENVLCMRYSDMSSGCKAAFDQ